MSATRTRPPRLPMVGRKQLPLHRHATERHLCGDQAGNVPRKPGRYERTCRQCGRSFVAEVTEAEWATAHCQRRVLSIHWTDPPCPDHFVGAETLRCQSCGLDTACSPASADDPAATAAQPERTTHAP